MERRQETAARLPRREGLRWLGMALGVGTAILWAAISGQDVRAQGCALSVMETVPCPPVLSTQIQGVAYDGRIFLIVGEHGFVATSTDGRGWAQQSCPLDVEFTSVAGGDGRFVAIGKADHGSSPVVLTSADGGTTWSIHHFYLRGDVSFAGGRFFSGEWTSPDGSAWEHFYLPLSDRPRTVAFGNGTWLMAEDGPAIGALLSTSTDGRSWRAAGLAPFRAIAQVAYGGQRYVAVDDGVYWSKDGVTWKKASGPQYGTPIYTGSQFIVLNNLTTWFSKDGKTWKEQASDISGGGTLFWSGTHLVAMAWGGPAGLIVRDSTDGTHWTAYPRCTGPGGSTRQVRYFEGPHLFVTAGSLSASVDGANWVAPSEPASALGVAYGDGRFVAVGAHGAAWVSQDGHTWVQNQTGSTEDLNDVAYGAGVFVAVGALGRIMTSPDGLAWQSPPSYFFGNLTSVLYAKGTFLAVGSDSSVGLVSTDGLNWRSTDLKVNILAYDVPVASFALGKFLVSSSSGLLVSEDARTWASLGEHLVGGNIVDWQGQALARGYDSLVAASYDLRTWSPLPIAGYGDTACLATDGGTVVLGGAGGSRVGSCTPYVDRVTPGVLSAEGPSPVTLEGTGFSGVTQVRFGDDPAVSFTVRSDREIDAVAPRLGFGPVAVTADADVLLGFVSAQNMVRGGDEHALMGIYPALLGTRADDPELVSIWGWGLSTATDLFIGGERWQGGFSKGETGISFLMGPRPAGHYDVVVAFEDGSRYSVGDGLTFIESPTITSTKIISSPAQIKVTGTGFTGDYDALINGWPYPIKKVKNSQSLIVSGEAFFNLMGTSSDTFQIINRLGPVRSNIVPLGR
jgi:hypothetical protein